MQLLDIDTISQGRFTANFKGLTPLEVKQARLSGISEVLTIRTIESGHYEIVGSPKSWFLAQALQEAQALTIIVDHLKIDELEILKTPTTEKLPVIEWAEKISDLAVGTPNLAELGRREGLSRSMVCNLVRIDAMPFDIKEQIRKHPKLIKLGHAKVLAGLDDWQRQALLAQIILKGLSVHETEKYTKNEKPVATIGKDPDTLKVENRLTEILGCRTTIDMEQGTLSIKYGKNNEVLQGVLEHLGYKEL